MKLASLRLTALTLGLVSSGFAAPETYIVDRYQDDSAKGSLRWGIEQSNTKHRTLLRQTNPYRLLNHQSKLLAHNGTKRVSLLPLMVQIISKAKVLKLVRVQTLNSMEPMCVLRLYRVWFYKTSMA